MRINYVLTKVSSRSGGAIYDANFCRILKTVYEDANLFDNEFVMSYCGGKSKSLISFNNYYRKMKDMIFDCDCLIINSRMYTRFLRTNFKKEAARHKNTRIIVIHHHNNYETHKGLLRIIHKKYERRLLEAATDLVIPNVYVIERVKELFDVNNIVSLPSSFEKKEYKLTPFHNNRILFVGNVERRKGLEYGITAFAKYSKKNPDVTFVIAGKYDNDKYYRSLCALVVKLGVKDRVVFEGRVSNERLDWLYSNSDLFLFPSLLEGYGWVMIEAMGRGVPVIGFDNSAMPYTIKDDVNGYLVGNKDVESMAKRIEGFYADESVMSRLQDGALETYRSVPSQEDLNSKTKVYIESWKQA